MTCEVRIARPPGDIQTACTLGNDIVQHCRQYQEIHDPEIERRPRCGERRRKPRDGQPACGGRRAASDGARRSGAAVLFRGRGSPDTDGSVVRYHYPTQGASGVCRGGLAILASQVIRLALSGTSAWLTVAAWLTSG